MPDFLLVHVDALFFTAGFALLGVLFLLHRVRRGRDIVVLPPATTPAARRATRVLVSFAALTAILFVTGLAADNYDWPEATIRVLRAGSYLSLIGTGIAALATGYLLG